MTSRALCVRSRVREYRHQRIPEFLALAHTEDSGLGNFYTQSYTDLATVYNRLTILLSGIRVVRVPAGTASVTRAGLGSTPQASLLDLKQ